MLAASGAGHCGYVDDGERQILSLSPELFFESVARRCADGAADEEAPRRAMANDAAERDALAASTKNRAENLMIVDLIRNDLSRIAEKGSVEVSDLFQVETYPTLHTMVSTVTARKRAASASPISCGRCFLAARSPARPRSAPWKFARTGKLTARRLLRRRWLFRARRLGTVQCRDPHPDNLAAGGARWESAAAWSRISQADSEYAECLLKARFFEAVRKPLELIETLRWDDGFVRLDGHMKRMEEVRAGPGAAL